MSDLSTYVWLHSLSYLSLEPTSEKNATIAIMISLLLG